MRIALAQINTTVGAASENARKIIETYHRAAALGAELVVFPELAITGYPPRDLLEQPAFIDANLAALDTIAEATKSNGNKSPGLIVGYVHRREGGEGKDLHNAAALIENGRIVSRHFKMLLPTYDVFDEARHFEPAKSVQCAEFRGTKIALTICEDFWNDRLYWRKRIYPIDPVEQLAAQKPDLMITISASPYWLGKPKLRAEMYSVATKRYGVPLVHVNLVGGNDSLIFDGRSNAWGADGRLLHQSPSCIEDLAIVDLQKEGLAEAKRLPVPLFEGNSDEEVYDALCLGIRDYVGKCGFKRVLIGLSGGIDSALTAALAADALGPEAVVGVSMPSQFSSDHSLGDAEALAKNLGIEYKSLPIQPIFDRFMETLSPVFAGTPFGLAEENLQARIRGNLLMSLSNKFGWLVLTTGNKSELAMGYCTLYGDMSGGLAVISDVFKTRVYSLSRWVNRERERIPKSSIEKPPSAELRPNQLDTDSLPPYEILDPIIEAYVERHLDANQIATMGNDPDLVKRIIRSIERNEYKRQQAPLGLKVTGKAFGPGRRMPIARGDA